MAGGTTGGRPLDALDGDAVDGGTSPLMNAVVDMRVTAGAPSVGAVAVAVDVARGTAALGTRFSDASVLAMSARVLGLMRSAGQWAWEEHWSRAQVARTTNTRDNNQ